MSIKIIGSADMHAVDPGHRNYEESLARFEDLANVANDTKADLIVVAGDMFHTGRPHPETVARVKAAFLRLDTAKVMITGGNHDHTNIASSFRNPIDAYLADQEWCCATVDAKPEVIDFKGAKIGLVPWLRVAGSNMLTSSEEELRRTIGELGDKMNGYPSMLFGHIALEEASFSSGLRGSELNMMTTTLEPHVSTQFLDDMPIAGWRLGHIHKRQNMGSGVGGYIGSSYKTSFGERNESKGFDVITLNSDNTCSVDFHQLKVRELVQVNLRDAPTAISGLDELLSENDILRVLISHDYDYTPAQNKTLRLLEKKGISVETRRLPKDMQIERKLKNVNIETTPLDAMREYINANEMEPDRANTILNLFKDVYEEVGHTVA